MAVCIVAVGKEDGVGGVRVCSVDLEMGVEDCILGCLEQFSSGIFCAETQKLANWP